MTRAAAFVIAMQLFNATDGHANKVADIDRQCVVLAALLVLLQPERTGQWHHHRHSAPVKVRYRGRAGESGVGFGFPSLVFDPDIRLL